jgi:hypothetical protein
MSRSLTVGSDAPTFLQQRDAVRLATAEALSHPSGPQDFDVIVSLGVSKSEMKTGIILREKACATLNLTGDAPALHIDEDARSYGISITTRSGALHQQPVTVRSVVLQKTGPSAEIVDNNLQRSVIVQVSNRRTPRRPRRGQCRAGSVRNILELTASNVPI